MAAGRRAVPSSTAFGLAAGSFGLLRDKSSSSFSSSARCRFSSSCCSRSRLPPHPHPALTRNTALPQRRGQPPRLLSTSTSTSSARSTTLTDKHTKHTATMVVAQDFESVLKGKYPAKDHAKRVTKLLREKVPDANGFIYLESCMTKMQEDNDSPEPFRQRRFFYYLTGCNLADCYVIYDIQSSKTTLFIPPIDPDDVIWSGLPLSIDEALAKYDVDEVRFTSDVNKTLASLSAATPGSTIFSIEGQVSGHVDLSVFSRKNLSDLKAVINRARVIKDEFEVAMIRKANQISGWGHKAVVERTKTAKNESELEAAFLERCVANGAKEMAYHPILASGRAAATLHYVDNSAPLAGKMNLLIDAGAEWDNYASDITRTFPLGGKFTPDSLALYSIVYKMQQEAFAQIKAGVLWDDVHVHAHRVAIDGLLSLGVLQGDKDEILEARTSAAFFPHGLGHYLGMDTHDVGGNPDSADKDILFRYLRLRNRLETGCVVTVEPGIYFCEFIIKPYLEDPKHSKFINKEVLDKFWDVGGVRIEDNVLVTETGCENLSDAIKEPGDIEAAYAAAK